MKLIKTESGWIAVGDENKNTTFFDGHINIDILAGTPDTLKLKFSPEVAAVLGVWDAEEEYRKQLKFEDYEHNPHLEMGFTVGFEKHEDLSAKREFTEENLRKVIGFCIENKYNLNNLNVDKFIENYVRPLLYEYEVETYEKTEDTLTIIKLK